MTLERLRALDWVGGSRRDFMKFPAAAKRLMGYALHLAQTGDKHEDAKPLKGFRGAGVPARISHTGHGLRGAVPPTG